MRAPPGCLLFNSTLKPGKVEEVRFLEIEGYRPYDRAAGTYHRDPQHQRLHDPKVVLMTAPPTASAAAAIRATTPFLATPPRSTSADRP